MGTRIRVLLVDEHPVILEGARSILERHGDIDVVGMARSGRAGLQALLMHHPDVAVLDLRLPDMPGLEVVRLARQIRPAPAILLFTGYLDLSLAQRLAQLGVLGYLDRTANPDDLTAAVRAASRGRSTWTSALTHAHFNVSQLMLTRREEDVLAFLVQGASNAEIAAALNISRKTAEVHVGRILEKLGARSRAQVPVLAHQLGLSSLDLLVMDERNRSQGTGALA